VVARPRFEPAAPRKFAPPPELVAPIQTGPIVADDVKATLLRLRAAAPLIPHAMGKALAASLEIGEGEARAILSDLADLLLEETTGLPEQGHAVIMRLSS
jgi:hypothetical protein